MIVRTPQASRVLLIRPGTTDFDDQGRIKGTLDMPMSDRGRQQVNLLAEQLSDFSVGTIYAAPCESARETAQQLAEGRGTRIKVIEAFRNVDHGLWHGKLIEEVRRNHPKVYRQGQDSPTDVCPPGGESIRDARDRVAKAIRKVLRKSGSEAIAIVIPDPMAWVVQSLISGEELSDLWKAETDGASWDLLESTSDKISES
ncbi:histidine phosphatase family protein [Rhodopirellula sp.]|nr:histidine phosphatase family protein [Rhodopirellula sp.]